MSVKTIDELPWALVQVLAHWKSVDESLAPAELGLSGNYGRGDMLRDLEQLNALTEKIFAAKQSLAATAPLLAETRKQLKEAMRSFTLSVRGLYSESAFVSKLPNLPDLLAHPGVFMGPARTIEAVWREINASGQPLVLGSGLTYARYQDLLASAERSFHERTTGTESERDLRRQREHLASKLRKRAMQYRDVVKGSFPLADSRVRSLPNLWPSTRKRTENA